MKHRDPINMSFFLTIFLLLLAGTWLQAQEDFEKYQQEQNKKFQQYVDETDRAFLNFLKQDWKQMQVLAGHVRDEEPKPVRIPVAETEPDDDEVDYQGPAIPEIPLPEAEPVDEAPIDITIPPDIISPRGVKVPVAFYGTKLAVQKERGFKIGPLNTLNQQAVVDFWEAVSQQKTKPLLEQMQKMKKELRLNDWAYFVLTRQVASGVLQEENSNRVNLLTWYLLLKSGYDVRAGYDENTVYILAASKRILYGASYFVYDDKAYYALSFNGTPQTVNSLFSYEGKYPDTKKTLNMEIDAAPRIQAAPRERIFTFTFKNETHKIAVPYNQNLRTFYGQYPLTELDIYFSAEMSETTRRALLKELKPLVQGKSEAEAVNLLLRFVQTAFEYQVDVEQFGKEKYFFAEETIYYPFCDCEDRSVLFAYLVRNLTGLKVVGLNYPGHVATAVAFNQAVNGQTIRYQNADYLVCDPTYINANIGMEMPNLDRDKMSVIAFN